MGTVRVARRQVGKKKKKAPSKKAASKPAAKKKKSVAKRNGKKAPAKKKASKKKSTKKVIPNGIAPLNGMEDEFEVPAELAGKADDYASAVRAKGKALSKYNTTKSDLITSMREHDVTTIRVTIGDQLKVVTLNQKDEINIKKPQDDNGKKKKKSKKKT